MLLRNCSAQSALLASPTRAAIGGVDNEASKMDKQKPQGRNPLLFLKRNLGQVVHKVGGTLDAMLSFPADDDAVPAPPLPRRVRGGVLLHGCETADDHFVKHDSILEEIKDLKGSEGLAVAGLEFRWEPCEEHTTTRQTEEEFGSSPSHLMMESSYQKTFSDVGGMSSTTNEALRYRLQSGDTDHGLPPDHEDSSVSESEASSMHSTSPLPHHQSPPLFSSQQRSLLSSRSSSSSSMSCCAHCRTRLYSIETNQLICSENRRKFITDGLFYDEVARLAQEVVFDQLVELGNLEWKVLHEDDEENNETTCPPICALVSKEMQPHLPTLIVVTGKGKVRAGMFSRQHLLVTGMEPSSALDTVARAVWTYDEQTSMRPPMNVVLLDPNCRTDRHAMTTIEKSMEKLLEEEIIPPTSPILIQAHSMAGAQVVRYLLEEEKAGIPSSGILHRLVAVAFSDSTHNIQWTKNANTLAPVLGRILDSDKCLYVRSSNKLRDNDWQSHESGQTVATTTHWQHRFGQVRTVWAGTTEHSLSDWHGRFTIWEHFEQQLLLWKIAQQRQEVIGSCGRGVGHATSSTGSSSSSEEDLVLDTNTSMEDEQ
mmetsp:Transcript_27507/g.40419  ORF Transcript_27507/g.40419 Transcript_27507/m.40419 type:complete len:596 (-) Transcript_27507:385-2172(-)